MKETSMDFELSFFERLVRSNPDFVDALIPLAEVYTRKGMYEKGLKVDRKLARLRKEDPMIHYNLACSLALVREKEDAILALEHAITLGYRDFDHMKKDSDLKILREDPRFKSLISKHVQPTKPLV